MADRIFRPDVGDYMNDQEYAIHKAKIQALNQAQNPDIQALAQQYKQSGIPSDDSMNKMNQDISQMPNNLSGQISKQIQFAPGGINKTSDGLSKSDQYDQDGFYEGGKVEENQADEHLEQMEHMKNNQQNKVPKSKFGRTSSKMSKNKANSELKASKDPEKFMEENKEPSIKGRKGVAF